MATATSTDGNIWWGESTIPLDGWSRWRIGPLTFWVRRYEHEWRLAWQVESGEVDLAVPESCCRQTEEPPESTTLERIASDQIGERLVVSPRLADRPVVVRPETNFRMAPKGKVELYVGTPVWVLLETSQPSHRLLDLPTRRPSDSWFGPSTTEGELCYAGRTMARLQRDNLPTTAHQAVTRVKLHNGADDDLLLERLNLPVPNLALFADEAGRLWTQTVCVERDHDGTLAEVRIEEEPPAEATGALRIAEPRLPMVRNVFSRALSALLS